VVLQESLVIRGYRAFQVCSRKKAFRNTKRPFGEGSDFFLHFDPFLSLPYIKPLSDIHILFCLILFSAFCSISAGKLGSGQEHGDRGGAGTRDCLGCMF
jgi:hypothetical protein